MKKDGNIIFYFERGSYNGGSLFYSIEIMDEKYVLYERPYNDFCWMPEAKYEIPQKELAILQKIVEPILKWQKNYEAEEDIDDGYGYSVYFRYGDSALESHGYEKYPEDYWTVISRLQRFMERLGKKYNPDYQRKGYFARVSL